MTVYSVGCILVGSLLISAAFGMGLGRLIKRADEEPIVNWLPLLPPVPPPLTPPLSRTLPCPAWFDVPTDCLSDAAVRDLFDSIVAGEFR